MRAASVVLVDDHPAIRAGLSGLLQDAGVRVLATAATVREGWDAITALRPRVAVLDHHLGGESGLLLCLRSQALDPPPRVVVYSAFADDRLRVLGLVAGAAAVVSKVTAPDDVVAAVIGAPVADAGGPVAPKGLREVGAGLDDRDLAILGMLSHGVAPAEIAATLSIDERRLRARRRAILDHAAGAAGRRPVSAPAAGRAG
jgi:DNA-binding NarL/FixJ family response regulator